MADIEESFDLFTILLIIVSVGVDLYLLVHWFNGLGSGEGLLAKIENAFTGKCNLKTQTGAQTIAETAAVIPAVAAGGAIAAGAVSPEIKALPPCGIVSGCDKKAPPACCCCGVCY